MGRGAAELASRCNTLIPILSQVAAPHKHLHSRRLYDERLQDTDAVYPRFHPVAGFEVPRAWIWLVVQRHAFGRARADHVAGDEAAARPERHHLLKPEDQVT